MEFFLGQDDGVDGVLLTLNSEPGCFGQSRANISSVVTPICHAESSWGFPGPPKRQDWGPGSGYSVGSEGGRRGSDPQQADAGNLRKGQLGQGEGQYL